MGFKTKQDHYAGVIVDKRIVVFPRYNWRGRKVGEVIHETTYKNNGKLVLNKKIIITKPNKRSIWKYLKDPLVLYDTPVEIMITDKEIVIQDGSIDYDDFGDVRREIEANEIKV